MNTIERIKSSLRGCRPKLSLGLSLFEDEFCLDLFGYLITLPFLDRFVYTPHEIMESWGLSYFMWSMHLKWGRHTKIVHMPWTYDHIKCEVLNEDGTWGPESPNKLIGKFQYQYTLKSGEVQRRTATVYIEKREWRRRWLRWFPLFALRRQSIVVTFDDEVGEGTGSWKGGCIGCGYDMLPDETMEDTLRRMERERKF